MAKDEKKTASVAEAAETAAKKPLIPTEVDQNQFIPVINGFQGRLIYKSSRTNEKFVWQEFGYEQLMELRELRSAKNTSKSFFANNWFMFDNDHAWVIDYLGLTQYYKNALKLEDFDKIFKLSPSEIEKKIAKLSEGQRQSVCYRAKKLIEDKEIDSLRVIAALEKALGVDLIEK